MATRKKSDPQLPDNTDLKKSGAATGKKAAAARKAEQPAAPPADEVKPQAKAETSKKGKQTEEKLPPASGAGSVAPAKKSAAANLSNTKEEPATKEKTAKKASAKAAAQVAANIEQQIAEQTQPVKAASAQPEEVPTKAAAKKAAAKPSLEEPLKELVSEEPKKVVSKKGGKAKKEPSADEPAGKSKKKIAAEVEANIEKQITASADTTSEDAESDKNTEEAQPAPEQPQPQNTAAAEVENKIDKQITGKETAKKASAVAKKSAVSSPAPAPVIPQQNETDTLPASTEEAAVTSSGETVSAGEETITSQKNQAFVHKLVEAADQAQATALEEDAAAQTTIRFVVSYYTRHGQSLFITAHHPLFGNGNPEEALPIQYLDANHWMAEITLNKADIEGDLIYNYLLREEDGTFEYEGGKDKKIALSTYKNANVTLLDSWDVAGYYGNAFFTEPFKEVILKDNYTPVSFSEPDTFTHTFKVKAPLLQKGQVVCLTGSTDALSNWSIREPLLLHKDKSEDYWHISLDLSNAEFPLSYKYGVFDTNNNELVQLEESAKRELHYAAAADTEFVLNDSFVRMPDNFWKGTGVAIPVFSLRTDTGFGCGEFTDIKKLADWCKQVGIKLIQLLPVNDTTSTKTWRDSYPYAAISAFALHAMYLNVDAIVDNENRQIADNYRNDGRHFNSYDTVDYEAVNDIKWKIIHEIYPLQKDATFASEDYKAFFEDNKHWLVPYAAFCVLRDKFGTAEFSTWSEHKQYDAEAIDKLLASGDAAHNAGMYFFVQYHLHLQLKEAAEYAHSHGIVMKGDIAIGISRNSADAWQNPQLYNLDMQAGAPPDDFAVKGQNWGFPTYNWQKMKEDGFAWWKQRFSQMSHYFDAFRIDHILGFFRIWSIPTESVEGIMGHFVPALPVHITEFHQWNTYFDYKRYCKPFINDQIISDLCGDQQGYVKDTFLTDDNDGTYSLKPEVATQKRVETYFSIREQNGHNNWLKQLLFDLISNVILFEEPNSNGQLFHFRFGMENTLSYQYLDDYTKTQLYYLSINYFYERQNEFWRQEAMHKLPALEQETDMLICGEDLGMVPASVPRVMQDLGLLSLEVQRMPKDAQATFTNLEAAPYLSVVTPSTHDMSTIRGWWEEDAELTQRFFNNQLGQHGSAPQYCEPWINRQIIEQHLYSPAMWSIFQLQDLLGIDEKLRRENPHDERINVPANPVHYWRYRMHLSVEELLSANDFNHQLGDMIAASGR